MAGGGKATFGSDDKYNCHGKDQATSRLRFGILGHPAVKPAPAARGGGGQGRCLHQSVGPHATGMAGMHQGIVRTAGGQPLGHTTHTARARQHLRGGVAAGDREGARGRAPPTARRAAPTSWWRWPLGPQGELPIGFGIALACNCKCHLHRTTCKAATGWCPLQALGSPCASPAGQPPPLLLLRTRTPARRFRATCGCALPPRPAPPRHHSRHPPTCVFSPRPRASSHGCSMPFWMKTRSMEKGKRGGGGEARG